MTDQPGNSLDSAPMGSSVLMLYPLRVPRGTQPVVGGDCGAPLHIFEPAPKGLELKIDPYLGQQPGDKVAVNVNGKLDIVNTLTQSDNDTVTLYLPQDELVADSDCLFTYTVTRGSQNMGMSEPLEVLYNAIRPGKEDTDPGVEGHSRLELLLPEVIKNGVGPDFPVAGAQVCVSYPYCRAYDVIRLNCNGHIVVHTVTLSEAPLPGSDTPVTVCFTVTRADLASGGDDPKFVFSYTVTDQLGNSPTPQSPWSAKQLVDVDLAGTRLPAPILREIQNDPTDDPSIVDRDKLAGNPLLLIVVTADNRFQAGDLIEATYTATIPGQPDVVVIVTGNVETDEFGQKKPCILQVANDKVTTNSAVRAQFTLKRGGTVIASSKTATAQVIGSDTITLNPPVPAANPVDPLAYPQGMTIQVAFAASLPGDQARLVLVDLMPDPPTFSDLPLDANHQATFNLQARFLGAWHGTAVQFVWALIRGGNEIARSGPLVLSVKRIADGDPRFPTPAIDGAVGGQLDVNKMQASDQLRIAAWWSQTGGTDTCWLHYEGVDINGRTTFDDLVGQPHDGGLPLIRPAPIGWLKTLTNDSPVTVTFKIQMAEGAALVTFPICTYTIKAETLILPAITMVRDAADRVISPGAETVARSVKLSGTAEVGAVVEIYDGEQLKGRVTATGGHWELPIAGLLVGDHIYSAKDTRGTSEKWTIRVIAVVPPRLVSITRQLGGSYPSGSRIPVTVSQRGAITFSVTCQALAYDRMIYINQINYGMSGVLVLAGSTSGISPASTASIHPHLGRTEWTLRDTASDTNSALPAYWNLVN